MAKRRKRKRKLRGSRQATGAPIDSGDTPPPKRDFTALMFSLASWAMLWLAMPGPGRGFAWLAWIAPVPLVWLVHSPASPHKVLRQVWVATLLYWLLILHFVRLPTWMLLPGWLALSAWLSVFGPLFVSVGRIMVHRLGLPTAIAVPLAFTGLEWIRVNFLTGFGLACVSHSQYQVPVAMQVASCFGAYGVTFAILFVAACIAVATAFAWRQINAQPAVSLRLLHVALATVALVSVWGWGSQRLARDAGLRKSAEPHKHLKVALIQSSIDTILVPQTAEEAGRDFLSRCELTHSARLLARQLDLIVWPESSFPYGHFLSDFSPTRSADSFRESQHLAWQEAIGYPGKFADAVPLLVGSSTRDPENGKAWNSALFFDASGNLACWYHKNHLVMFGEYFPVVRWIPWLKEIVRGFSSWTPGTRPERIGIGDVSLAPNICFETTVPHLIRQHVNLLEGSGQEIDVLVNVTNDGWFFGTSCLDLHLACNTFRAVEMQKPMLVSANTGFSGYIDEFGRHVEIGPRREEAELICDVRVPLPTKSLYRSWGAWIACAMGWVVVVVGVATVIMSRVSGAAKPGF